MVMDFFSKVTKKEEPPKFKIPPRRVNADDCTVVIGRVVKGLTIVEPGEPHQVHVGEWVEVLPVTSLAMFNALLELGKMAANLTDNKALEQLCEALGERVTDWNFTGLDGKPLAKPYKNPHVLMGLSEDELIWLVTAAQGETQAERKKGYGPSETKS